MKRLYLVRHAKSSWRDATLDDIDRPLNKRGKKDAPSMAGRLKKLGIKPDVLISSPAKRALDTAKIFARKLDFQPKNIIIDPVSYEAGAGELLELLRGISEDVDSAMLFGHNPAITELAAMLSEYPVGNIPTAGVFCIDFPLTAWGDLNAGCGVAVFFDYPKKKSAEPGAA